MKLVSAAVTSVRDFVNRMLDGEHFYFSIHSTTYKYYYDSTKTRPFVVMNLDTAVIQPWYIDNEIICRLKVEAPWYVGMERGQRTLCWVGQTQEQANSKTQAVYVINYVAKFEKPFQSQHNSYTYATPVLPEELKY